MKKLLSLLCASALLMSLVACEKKEETPEVAVPTITAVETATVERGDLFVESQVSGNVMASRTIPVLPKTSCKVKTVYVQAGDTVAENDPLFEMDTADLRDLYKSALNSYNLTKTMLDAQVAEIEKNLNNLRELYAIGGVARNQVEQLELTLLQTTTTRETTLAQMGLDTVLEVLADPIVRAPIAGTVTTVGVTEGVMAANTNVAVIVEELSSLRVMVNVSETLQPHIQIGDSVKLQLSALGGEELIGTVAGVASSVNQGSALYLVQISLPEDAKAAIGMFARVTFSTDAHYDVVLVPTETILTQGEEQCVYIVNEDNTASRIVITTGLVGATQTEVTSGLTGGETLVTRGQSFLTDGAQVSVSVFETEEEVLDETVPQETIEPETETETETPDTQEEAA